MIAHVLKLGHRPIVKALQTGPLVGQINNLE